MSAKSEKGETHPPEEMTIAKYTMAIACQLTGVEAHRIRRFEEGALLKPVRTEAGQRIYCDSDIELIKEIARLGNEGINVAGIKAILAMRRGERE